MNPILLALICVFAWSFIPVVTKLGTTEIDNFQFLFWSNLLSCLVVIPFIKRDRAMLKASFACISTPKGLLLNMVLGLFGCCLYSLFLYYGYMHANSVQVLIIQYLWPALITVFALFLLKERLNAKKIIAIICGFIAAVLVITQGNFSMLNFTNIDVLIIVFIGAHFFALFSVLSKKEKRVDDAFAIFFYFVWGTIFSGVSVFLFSDWRIPDVQSFIIIMINGALVNGVTFILWIIALAKADASRISPLVYLSPVLSIVWITLFFNEPFRFINIIAMGFAIFSGLLVIEQKKKVKNNLSF